MESPEPVFVLATFKTRPGKETEAETLFKSILSPTHQESGCVSYSCHCRLDQPGTYYFIEKWRSQRDLDEHLQSSHIRAAFARKEELFVSADIGMISPLPGGDPVKGVLFK